MRRAFVVGIQGLVGIVAVGGLLLATWSTNRAGGEQAGEIRTATLRTNDFFWRTISLITGDAGHVVQDREVKNAGSHLDFGGYYAREFSVAIQGGEIGAILDLGHWTELAEREGYTETIGGGQGFNSIHFRNGEMVILQSRNPNTYKRFEQGDQFVNHAPLGIVAHAPARLGHIYLVRILGQGFELITKFLVVGGSRGLEATIVWENLERQ